MHLTGWGLWLVHPSVHAALPEVLIESASITDATLIHQDSAGTGTFDKILPPHARERYFSLVQTNRGGNLFRLMGLQSTAC